MTKYFMYPQEKVYQIISDAEAMGVTQMKEKGLAVYVQSSGRPSGEYMEDNNLYNRMVKKMDFINLVDS